MDSQKLHDNRHDIIIDTHDTQKVFNQIVLWGEAPWWPVQSMMQFVRIGTRSIQEGTMYHQKVKLPFGPRWLSLVSEIVKNTSVSRKYFDSFIIGEEIVSLILLEDKIKVEYVLQYQIKGVKHRILWKIILRRLHDSNIRLILQSLKNYIEQ